MWLFLRAIGGKVNWEIVEIEIIVVMKVDNGWNIVRWIDEGKSR
jgi:hypothetical protein